MVDPVDRQSTAGQRLSAPESFGVSTLEPGLRPPGQTPGRHVSIRVHMLDDSQEVFSISQRSPGKVLFDLVCVHLNLTEGDYFGLEYQDQRKQTLWLDLLKPTLKQIRRPKNTILRFVVKFFPPDHTQLSEELTRYLFALQIKRDLACGRLICNDTSAALIVSHIIQSEIGDFDETQSWQHLLHNKYLPDQDAIRDKITDCHRKHVGQTPAVSDFQLLEIARRLEMYGIRLHPAKDREGTKLSLAVAHTGVLVFQGYTKINAFNWSKVRKLSFKRKRFLIKLRADPAQSGHHDTLEFSMASRDCCKVFWKICVEYHAFFRLFEEPKPKPKPIIFTRGSSFRFSGRTQKQIIDYVKDSELKKIPFERKHSKVLSQCSTPVLTCTSPLTTQSVLSVPLADQLDSARPAHRADSNGSEELPVIVSSTNGFHDAAAQPGPDPARSQQDGAGSSMERQFVGTGPSCRAHKGSSSSIPYIDSSDIDECDVTKNHRGHGNTRNPSADQPYRYDNRAGGQAGNLFGVVNGFYHTNHQGRMQIQQPSKSFVLTGNANESREFADKDVLFHGHFPLHSTPLDDIFHGRDKRVVPLGSGTRSQCSSPAISSFHRRTGSLGHADSTDGHRQPRSQWDDGGHYFSKRPGVTLTETASVPPSHPLNRYGSYSPITNRMVPHYAKPYNNNNVRNCSDTDPFILSQLTSTPIHHVDRHRQAPGSAPMERRMMVTNGNHVGNLLVPGQPRSNTVQRLYGRQGKQGKDPTCRNLNQTVQAIDGSTSSGTDTSDTESDTGSSGAYGQPLMYGNPGVVTSMNSVNSSSVNLSPIPRNKFSFGSLQLEEADDGTVEEEDGSFRLRVDDVGGRVFSC